MRCSLVASERVTLISLQYLGRSKSRVVLKTQRFVHHAPLFVSIFHLLVLTCPIRLFYFPLRLQAVATLDSIVSCHELDVARGYHPDRSKSPPAALLPYIASHFLPSYPKPIVSSPTIFCQLENTCWYRPDSSYCSSDVLSME